jgi:hypothetical protein
MAKVRGFSKRLEPFGATKARGKQFAAERKLKNRIHELEQQVAALERREADAHVKLVEAERRALIGQPTAGQHAALKVFAALPTATMVELGLVDHGLELARWSLELQGKKVP